MKRNKTDIECYYCNGTIVEEVYEDVFKCVNCGEYLDDYDNSMEKIKEFKSDEDDEE